MRELTCCQWPRAFAIAGLMIGVCLKHGVLLAVNHRLSFMEQYCLAYNVIRSGQIGPLSSMMVNVGNFGLAMSGTHYFQLFREMAHDEPRSAAAWFTENDTPNPRGAMFKDPAGAVRVVSKTGKRLYIESGADQGSGIQNTYAGRYSFLSLDEIGNTGRLSTRKEEERELPTTRYLTTPRVQEFAFGIDNIKSSRSLLESFLTGRNYPTGEDGLTNICTLVAYASNENGNCTVNIDGSLREDRVSPWA